MKKVFISFLALSLIFITTPINYALSSNVPIGQINGSGSVTVTDSGKIVQLSKLSRLLYPGTQFNTANGEAYIRISKSVFNVFKNSSGNIASSKILNLNAGKLAFNIASGSEMSIQTPVAVVKPAKVMLTSLKPVVPQQNASGTVTVLPDGKTIVSAVSGNLDVKNLATGETKVINKGSSITVDGTKNMMIAQLEEGVVIGGEVAGAGLGTLGWTIVGIGIVGAIAGITVAVINNAGNNPSPSR